MRLAQVDRKYVHGFAVFRDGAARNDDALLAEYFRDLAVGQRFLAVFRADELLDQRADRGARGRAAGIGGDMAAEKIFEFVDAARREHEFLGGDARDRRFVQIQRVRDLPQHQRAHRDFTVLEKVALAVDDRLRDAQDGVEALLHVLDQPARFLQLAGELLVSRIAVALQDIGVQPVDAQFRHRVRVERGEPYAHELFYHD